MKNIGGGWSTAGADNMARLLAAKANAAINLGYLKIGMKLAIYKMAGAFLLNLDSDTCHLNVYISYKILYSLIKG